MPYCRKCGTKLDETAKFCNVCGTPVEQSSPNVKQVATTPTSQQVRRASLPLAVIAVIIVAVLVFAAIIIAFLPFQPVNFNQANEASAPNVNTLRLVFNADIANVNVMLRDLPGNQRAATNISAIGWKGIFGDDNPLALSFKEDTSGSTLTYLVNVSKSATWSGLNILTVACDVYVDPSVSLDILVQTKTGSINIDAEKDSTFQQLILNSNTGSIVATLKNNIVIAGDVVLDAQTGSVMLSWNNVKVARNIEVRVTAATGSANLNVTQTTQLGGNVALSAEATTGSVDLTMAIQNDVAARISSGTTFGSVNIQQTGFSSNNAPIQSENYPAGDNFDVTLKATTGGININANYEVGGTRT